MLPRLALVLAGLVGLGVRASSVGCPVFDSDMNLYVLGFPGGDVMVGAQTGWPSPNVTPLTNKGRPPFDGANPPRCYLAQFFNAIYILGADNSNPTAVYIFDVKGLSWSMQAVDAGGLDVTNMVEILDHDTNVFFALSGNTIWDLKLNDQVAALSTPLTWSNLATVSFPTTNYKPTIGIANNHMHFFGVPGAQAGQAFIFVIHFSFSQPDAQAYPSVSGSPFPVTHGQAPSLFRASGIQDFIAFIPDDLSATYLVDVITNTTLPLPGPTDKTTGSIFTASETAVVQLTPAGKLFYLPIDQDDIRGTGSNAKTTWTALNAAIPSSGGNTGSSTTGGSSTSTPGGKSGGTSTTAGGSSTPSTGSSGQAGGNGGNAAGHRAGIALGAVAAALLGALLL